MRTSTRFRPGFAMFLLVAASGLCSAQPMPSDAEVLRALNRAMLEDLIIRNDAAAFLRHAHEDFIVIAPGGRVEDRARAAAGAGAFDAGGIAVSGEHVTMAGDTAVVVGRLDIDGEMRPVGKVGPMKFMSVFVRTDGTWKLLARSLTPCHALAVERGFC